jgi:hypothetical protein
MVKNMDWLKLLQTLLPAIFGIVGQIVEASNNGSATDSHKQTINSHVDTIVSTVNKQIT